MKIIGKVAMANSESLMRDFTQQLKGALEQSRMIKE